MYMIKHGLSKTKEYKSWLKMRERCYDKNSKFYHKYGGAGITVCDRWRESNGFINFIEDIGMKPSPEYTLDRINNEGNYSPENCRWATRLQQATNTSQARLYRGVTIAGWARKLNVSNTTFHRHVKRIGYREAIEYFAHKSTSM